MIGVYCTSKKPEYWEKLYNSLSQNKTEFNLCITGPNPPIHDLPKNFKYIQTNVKPTQCFFIAACNTDGDLLYQIGDDMTFTPGLLDSLANTSQTYHKNIIVATTRHGTITNQFAIYELDPETKQTNYLDQIKFPIPYPACPMMYRETFMNIGIDKGYLGIWWGMDIACELFFSRRGQIVIDYNHNIEEYDVTNNEPRLTDYTRADYAYWLCMWTQVIDGKFQPRERRLQPIEPLVYSSDVLTVSQGITDPSRWD